MPLQPPEKDRRLQVFDANESSEIAVRTLGGIHAQEGPIIADQGQGGGRGIFFLAIACRISYPCTMS